MENIYSSQFLNKVKEKETQGEKKDPVLEREKILNIFQTKQDQDSLNNENVQKMNNSLSLYKQTFKNQDQLITNSQSPSSVEFFKNGLSTGSLNKSILDQSDDKLVRSKIFEDLNNQKQQKIDSKINSSNIIPIQQDIMSLKNNNKNDSFFPLPQTASFNMNSTFDKTQTSYQEQITQADVNEYIKLRDSKSVILESPDEQYIENIINYVYKSSPQKPRFQENKLEKETKIQDLNQTKKLYVTTQELTPPPQNRRVNTEYENFIGTSYSISPKIKKTQKPIHFIKQPQLRLQDDQNQKETLVKHLYPLQSTKNYKENRQIPFNVEYSPISTKVRPRNQIFDFGIEQSPPNMKNNDEKNSTHKFLQKKSDQYIYSEIQQNQIRILDMDMRFISPKQDISPSRSGYIETQNQDHHSKYKLQIRKFGLDQLIPIQQIYQKKLNLNLNTKKQLLLLLRCVTSPCDQFRKLSENLSFSLETRIGFQRDENSVYQFKFMNRNNEGFVSVDCIYLSKQIYDINLSLPMNKELKIDLQRPQNITDFCYQFMQIKFTQQSIPFLTFFFYLQFWIPLFPTNEYYCSTLLNHQIFKNPLLQTYTNVMDFYQNLSRNNKTGKIEFEKLILPPIAYNLIIFSQIENENVFLLKWRMIKGGYDKEIKSLFVVGPFDVDENLISNESCLDVVFKQLKLLSSTYKQSIRSYSKYGVNFYYQENKNFLLRIQYYKESHQVTLELASPAGTQLDSENLLKLFAELLIGFKKSDIVYLL